MDYEDEKTCNLCRKMLNCWAPCGMYCGTQQCPLEVKKKHENTTIPNKGN